MDDLTQQCEEIEALSSIYASEWKADVDSTNSYNIDLISGDITLSLYFTLPKDYPSSSPPVCELSAPSLHKLQKNKIYNALNELYLENIGQTILFQWIEKAREILEESTLQNTEEDKIQYSLSEDFQNIKITTQICPEIIHGNIIEDRKSHFQAHVAVIKHPGDVDVVFQELMKERKIAEATHNIIAWRCGQHHNCEDDGERAAGSKLLYLLEILHLDNVVVVVSRWYGGIHLGPHRFRHINNAARQALVQAGIIKN